MGRRARLRRKRTLYHVTAEEIAEIVGLATGLSVEQFRQELEQPDAYGKPEILNALFSLGVMLAVEPEHRPATVIASEAYLAAQNGSARG